MSEWYAVQIDNGRVLIAARLPDDLGDADRPVGHYLMSYPTIDPAFINDAPDQFYCSDTRALLGVNTK